MHSCCHSVHGARPLILMIEVDKPTAAETEANAPDDIAPADVSALHIPALELQPGTKRSQAERYQLDELLRYHDRAFVANAYAALQKRDPTPAELTRALDDLRSGRRGKIEIIEDLLAAPGEGGPTIHVQGLPSPMLRRISRWPVVGYTMRLLRDFRRLPTLIRHQQQFEAYSMAQQQHIADYLNDVLAPAVRRQEEDSPVIAGLAANIADAVESVVMLADSLVELSARQSELQEQLQNLQAESQNLQAQLQQVREDHRDLQAQLKNFQARREQSETQLHTNLVALTEAQTEAQTAQQQRLDELFRKHDETAAAQREFLVQEQRVIVEAQKVALAGLQDEVQTLAREQEKKRTKVAAEVRRLRGLIDELRAAAPADPGAKEREQP